MPVKFNVKMTEDYMYDFMLYHNYTHFSGLLGLLLGIVGAVLAIVKFFAGDSQTAGFALIVAVLFLVVTPRTTKQRASMQVKNSKMFQDVLEYEFNDEGITVRQGELEAKTPWEECSKVVSTKKSVIVYITRVRALIFPKTCIGEQYEEAIKMIRTHMPSKKVKIR